MQITRKIELHDNRNIQKNNEANFYINQGRYGEAELKYREIIDESPNEYIAYHGLGSASYYQGNYEKSRTYYYKALNLNPDFADSYIGLGAIELTLENYNIALDYQNRALKLDPEYAGAYYARATTYKKLGKTDQAILDLKKVIKLAKNTDLAMRANNRLRKYVTKQAN